MLPYAARKLRAETDSSRPLPDEKRMIDRRRICIVVVPPAEPSHQSGPPSAAVALVHAAAARKNPDRPELDSHNAA